MKEITAEERKRIFALYHNQLIAGSIDPSNKRIFCTSYIFNGAYEINKCLLNVIPLKHISDLHAATVSEILGFTVEHVKNGKAFCKQIESGKQMTFNFHPLNCLEAFDFLRSRSYALPYRNHSVPDLVTAGVFKLV